MNINQVLPIADFYYLGEGMPRPNHYRPGDWGDLEFDFYVE